MVLLTKRKILMKFQLKFEGFKIDCKIRQKFSGLAEICKVGVSEKYTFLRFVRIRFDKYRPKYANTWLKNFSTKFGNPI